MNLTTFFFQTTGIPSAVHRRLTGRRVCKISTTPKKIGNVLFLRLFQSFMHLIVEVLCCNKEQNAPQCYVIRAFLVVLYLALFFTLLYCLHHHKWHSVNFSVRLCILHFKCNKNIQAAVFTK